MVSGASPHLALLCDYPQITEWVFNVHAPLQGVHHWILIHGPPIWSHPHHLCPEKRLSIIHPSWREWAFPLHVAPKANGKWPCGSYHCLNLYSFLYQTLDFTAGLSGAVIFSKINLSCRHPQIPVHPQDIHKTGVTTPFGLWEFLWMLFSLCSVGQTLQHLMSNILPGLPFILVDLDDFLFASGSPDEHLDHLHQVFDRLQQDCLIIRQGKCSVAWVKSLFLVI